MARRALIGLDVGEKRIGVSVADASILIAVPFLTVEVDGSEIETIAKLIVQEEAKALIIGYPRNQQGEATAQTAYVELFAKRLEYLSIPIYFQDESLTSVLAEQQLKAHNKPYSKGDIDAQAAALILQDYLELNHG